MRRTLPIPAAVFVAVLALTTGLALADGRAGYYYPEITSEETFARTLGRANIPVDRAMRAGFITEITKAQIEAPEHPRFVIFAKGAEAQHMIIVALDDAVFSSLFRARAVLAQLTSQSRSTDFFINNGLETTATWFDLAKLLGFEDIVISDGLAWAHRVDLRP